MCEDNAKSEQARQAQGQFIGGAGMAYGSTPTKQAEPDYRLQRAEERLMSARIRELTALREVLAGVVPAVNRFVNDGAAHTVVSGSTRQESELAANHLGVLEQLRQLKDVLSYSGIR